MIGYMTLYFKIKCDKQIAYGKTDFDFSVCPTEGIFEELKRSLGDCYRELTGCEKAEAEFCSEEEYESNEQREIANYSWG